MIGRAGTIGSDIASAYALNNQKLKTALDRIASGKNNPVAQDDLVEFSKILNLRIDIDSYKKIKQDLARFKTFTSAAAVAGSTLYENLNRMKQLARQYSNTNEITLKEHYKTEFNSLINQISSVLDNTTVDGKKVTVSGNDITSVSLTPDDTSKLNLTFSTITDGNSVSQFDITDTSAVHTQIQNQIDNALSYLSEANAFDTIALRHEKLIDVIVSNKETVKSLIQNVDEAHELTNIIDLNIRREATGAMMAQGHFLQNSVSKLYESDTCNDDLTKKK